MSPSMLDYEFKKSKTAARKTIIKTITALAFCPTEKEMIDITTSKINKGFYNLLKKIKNGPILFFSAIEFGPYSLNLLTASSVVRPVNLFSFCLTIIL